MKKIIMLLVLLISISGCEKNTDNEILSIEKNNEGIISYSCYDYILDTMSKPQYYSGFTPYYNFDYYEIKAKEAMPNSTAWKYDEESETFYRGYSYVLRLDFLNNTAFQEMSINYNPFGPLGIVTSDYEIIQTLDFNNRTIYPGKPFESTVLETYTRCKVVDENGNYVKDENGDYTYYPYSYFFDNPVQPIKKYYSSNNGNFLHEIFDSTNYHIEKTMYKYNKKFESAGCPLINQPKGTMEKYKEVQANVVQDEDNSNYLYSSPLDIPGFDWDASKADITWISDYRDAFDVEVPNSEPVIRGFGHMDENDTFVADGEYNDYMYSPVYVFFIDPDIAKEYIEKNNHQTEPLYVSEYGTYRGALTAFGAYVVKPIIERIYGYNATFFYSYGDVITPNYKKDVITNPTKDDYLDGKKFNWVPTENTYYGECLSIYPLNDYSDHKFLDYAFTGGGIKGTYYAELMDICNYYEIDMPFDDDYLIKLLALYDYNTQKELGLR